MEQGLDRLWIASLGESNQLWVADPLGLTLLHPLMLLIKNIVVEAIKKSLFVVDK